MGRGDGESLGALVASEAEATGLAAGAAAGVPILGAGVELGLAGRGDPAVGGAAFVVLTPGRVNGAEMPEAAFGRICEGWGITGSIVPLGDTRMRTGPVGKATGGFTTAGTALVVCTPVEAPTVGLPEGTGLFRA